MVLQSNTKDLTKVLREIGGSFFVVTTKQTLDTQQAIDFVEKAREKRMNDFNIANLIRSEQGFVSNFLR